MPVLNARDLLDAAEFTAVTATVADANPDLRWATAERIVVDALAFVATAAMYPSVPMAPSRVVDEGWHALVLHTALYRRLCERLGRFVDHFPERPDPARQGTDILDRTTALIRETGYGVDEELWETPLAGIISVAAQCGHAPRCGPIEPAVRSGLPVTIAC